MVVAHLTFDIEVDPTINERHNFMKHACSAVVNTGLVRPSTRACRHTAVFIIDGVAFCQIHAGRYLLKQAVSEYLPEDKGLVAK